MDLNLITFSFSARMEEKYVLYQGRTYLGYHNKLNKKDNVFVSLKDKLLYGYIISITLRDIYNLIYSDRNREYTLGVLEDAFVRILLQAFLMKNKNFLINPIWDQLKLYDECNTMIEYHDAEFETKYIKDFFKLVRKHNSKYDTSMIFENGKINKPEGLIMIKEIRRKIINRIRANNDYKIFIDNVKDKTGEIKNFLILMNKKNINENRAKQLKLMTEKDRINRMILFYATIPKNQRPKVGQFEINN